jgi:hypothetical protein
VVECSLEPVEDEVETELEVLLSSGPHDLGDDLYDMGKFLCGELAQDVGRYLLGLLDLEGQVELLEGESVEVTVQGVPGIERGRDGEPAFA